MNTVHASPGTSRTLRSASGKVLSRHDAALAISCASKPMVFTNGVFDILHRGHCNYLAQARALGELLVVGVNSDSSVRGLNKGPERPLNTETDRAFVLASLQSVDFVVIFDEPTPASLLMALRPDVYVKGGDYDIESLEETRLVRGWGGRSLALPFVDGYSTTRMVAKLRDQWPGGAR